MENVLPRIILTLAAAWVVSQSPLHAGSKDIVVCDFSRDKDGAAPITLPKEDMGGLPLLSPTGAVSYGEGGKLFVQAKGIDGYTKPMVVFTPGLHPDSAEGAAGIKLKWDLRQAGLGSGGIFELEFTVIPIELPIQGGGRMKFTLFDADGRAMQDLTVHVSDLPVVSFDGEKFGTPMKKVQASVGQPIEVRFRLDLDKKQWSTWIDGEPALENQPFPQAMTDVYPEISLGEFDFGSEGGLGDRVGGSYALGAVELVEIEK